MDEELKILNEVDAEVVEPVVEMQETVETIEVDDIERFEIEVEDAIGWVGGDNTRHYSLYGRDEPDQHPITSIIGLREELNDIEALDVVYSNERNQANYYLWEDENVLQEDRVGYFVSVCSDINKIKLCTSDNDIFGVTVDGAGFIGGQADIPRDIKYGLVVTTGVVHVRCESPVNVGDYVVSNDYGYATSNKNGYRVAGRHQIDGVEYAEITLAAPINRICKLSDDVENVNKRMDDAESNIASTMRTANEAYKKASEAGEISEEAIKNALEALGKANDSSDKTNEFESRLENANELATQAKSIAESATVSAESIRGEAVSVANQTLVDVTNLRDNLNVKIEEMERDLDVAVNQAQSSKENLESIRKEINDIKSGIGSIGPDVGDKITQLEQVDADLNNVIQDAVKDIKDISDTLAPLAQWPEGSENPTGVAGFVAQANEDSATLASMVEWKGEAGESLAGFVQGATENNATVSAIANYKRTDVDIDATEGAAGLIAQVSANKASAELVAKLDDNIAGIQAQVGKNASSVTVLASQVIGSYVVIAEYPDSDESKDRYTLYYESDYDMGVYKGCYRYYCVENGIWGGNGRWDHFVGVVNNNGYVSISTDLVYYVEPLQIYWYYKDGEWTETSNIEETGLKNALAGIQQTANENKASIEMITNFEGEFGRSITGFVQEATKENATVKAIASYQQTDTNGNVISDGAAGLKAQVEANKSAIDTLTSLEGDGYSGLAGLTAQVSANKSSVTTLASHIVGEFENTDDWVEDGKDINTVYYAKNNGRYYYYDGGWKDTDKAYEAGLTGSLAGVQSVSDGNKAQLDAMVAYDKNEKSALAGLTAYVDENSANISVLANYNNEDSGHSGTAGLVSDVNDNTSKLSVVANHEFTQDDGTIITGLAGLQAQVNDNTSNVSLVSRRMTGKYTIIPELVEEKDISKIYGQYNGDTETMTYYYYTNQWNETPEWTSILSIDTNVIYYVPASKQYWYYNNNDWDNTTDAYEAGLPASVAGIQVETDDNSSSINQLISWQGDTQESMTRIEQKTDDNGASINLMVSSVDKYSVGEYSQAYGLTREQAASILKPGYVYIPTDNFDKCCDAHSNIGTHCETFLDDGEINEFTPRDYYVWGINDQDKADWIEHGVNGVWIGNEVPANSMSTLKYWYIDSNVAPVGYEPYALYIWETSEGEDPYWKKVNILSGNSSNRAVSMIRQTTDKIAIDVADARSNITSHQQWLDSNSANIQDVVSWKSEVANNVSQIATIKQKADDVETSVALVVEKTDNGKVIDAASIITAINDDQSNIMINADKINIDASDLNISADDIDLTGVVKINDYITMDTLGKLAAKEATIDGKITADEGKIGGWNIVDDALYQDCWIDGVRHRAYMQAPSNPQGTSSAFGVKIMPDEGEVTWPFYVRYDGSIRAAKGTIGGWTLGEKRGHYVLYSASTSTVPGTGMSVSSSLSDPAFYAGYSGTSSGQTPWDYGASSGSWRDYTKFYVTQEGQMVARNAEITGKITATSGKIGGWNINEKNLDSSYNGYRIYLASASEIENGTQNWIRCYNTSSGTTYFSVSSTGKLTATGATIGGTVQAGTVLQDGVNLGSSALTKIIDYAKGSQYQGTTWRHKDDGKAYISLAGVSLYLNAGGSGTVQINGNSSYNSGSFIVSDINQKHSIDYIDDKYELFFNKVTPRIYKYNDGTSDRYHTGFIAQEVESAQREAGLNEKDLAIFARGTYLDEQGQEFERCMLRYMEFIALNTWQIQKAKTRIVELENKVAELEKLIKEK